ncbi:MAG TPA: SDR family NAD(P)-dependent oxidoreductase [Xanthomonadaceae bacterium]|nr:SDR family NAD(P)-dependent oxidoreductase [Xanthomonadaceae bacterium]
MTQARVLITGAGSGLGQALAQRWAAAGAAVACADIDPARAGHTCAQLAGSGHLALEVDVAGDASMQRLHGAVLGHWPAPLDVLVNNAGIAAGGRLVDTTIQEWRELLEINLLGVVRGCRAFLPAMIEAGRGHVLNVASFAALAGGPGIMTYGVSKAGVYTLSEQLRAELHGTGVGVSVACPAFFRTNLLANWRGDARMREVARRLTENATDTLDQVADRIFAATARGQFLILPTGREAMRWRLKRYAPGLYFRQLMKLVASRRNAEPGR